MATFNMCGDCGAYTDDIAHRVVCPGPKGPVIVGTPGQVYCQLCQSWQGQVHVCTAVWRVNEQTGVGTMEEQGTSTLVEEAGVGSRLRKYVCQCTEHTIGGRVIPGPYAFRGAASVEYSVFCQFCDAVFTLVPATVARKRKSKLCGLHCPDGSHEHG